MTRYFFDLTDDAGEMSDALGTERKSFDQMRAQARRILCDIASEEASNALDELEFSLRVRDGADLAVYEVSLSIVGRRQPR